MKNLLILLIALLAFTSCKKETVNLDPYAKLAFNATASKAIPSAPYSMDTIVRYAYEGMYVHDNPKYSTRLSIATHDLIKKKFWIGEAQSVVYVDKNNIAQLGWLVTNNIRDFVITAVRGKKYPNTWLDAEWYFDHVDEDNPRKDIPSPIFDTIAYIPNKQIKANEAAIKKAFDEQNYDLCLQLFENAYVFTPITGEQWRALKAKNEQ